MSYRHDIERCFAAAIGEGGLDEAAYAAALAETAPALAGLRTAHAEATLPLLALPGRRDDLPRLGEIAGRYRDRFADVLVLGMGGSSLGGQTLCALAGPARGRPRLHFVDNIDPHSLASLLESLELRDTGVLAITKSGTTAETLSQLLVVLDALRGAVGPVQTARHVVGITEPKESPLTRLAAEWGFETLDHDPGVGGRYSVLSLVGVLPGLIAGLDAEALRDGAAEVLAATLAAVRPEDAAPAVGAAIAVGLLRSRGATATVLMPYVDRLRPFAHWFAQLWAESLGKDGSGTTPVAALGATDQHSQLQLFLDGPGDKMFTLVTLATAGARPRVAPDLARDEALAYLRGHTVGDLLDAEARATRDTLARNGRPVRVFALEGLDERVLGALFMHFMLETIVTARLLGVNPFDQPAVEQGKVLARAYLAGETPP